MGIIFLIWLKWKGHVVIGNNHFAYTNFTNGQDKRGSNVAGWVQLSELEGRLKLE